MSLKPSASEMTTAGKPPSDPTAQRLALQRADFLASGDAGRVLQARSEFAEAKIAWAYEQHIAGVLPQSLAVVAVGGFGRRELFPHSDIDVCLLVESEKVAGNSRSEISSFLQLLWDSDLRVSQSVRTIGECSQLHDQNAELSISLLDHRFLTGDARLYGMLEPKLKKFFENQRQSLIRHLCRLARSRHAQYKRTIYHLEPNIKEGPGGLRDLHLLEWFRKLSAPRTGEIAWEEQLEPARRFLYRLRTFLHYRSGRDSNILNFDAQEEIVEQPYTGSKNPETYMREYFRHARGIFSTAIRALDSSETKGSSLLAGFRDWRSRLSNADFTVANDRVFFRAPHAMEKDPELPLRLFEFVARHGIRLSLDAERRLREALPKLRTWFSTSRPLWPAIREILSLPHAATALRSMEETGFMRTLFPEWEGIECLVIRDFYHRYTVDEHTLVAIENLQALPRSTEPGHRRFGALLSEMGEIAVLRLALLFHDVGKGREGASHSEESVKLARSALERIQTPRQHLDMILFLIEHHLILSTAMTTRDLDDPATARFLAGRMGTLEGLRYLTLLTYGDVSAVNPTALSPWRMEQLWRVYLITHQELTRELQAERITSAATGLNQKDSFLKGLPVRYLRTHSEEEINLHFELENLRKEAEIALDIRKTGSGYQMTVLAKDRLFLFASVAGTLSSFGMNILKAEAFANQQGTILDTFVFEDPGRMLELNPQEMERLEITVERVLLGRLDVRDLLKQRPRRPLPGKNSGIRPRVAFDGTVSETSTLVEVVAEDRPGLLFELASALSEASLNIDLVLVDTEAHKAIDVFYVSREGRKLDEASTERLRQSLLAVCGG